MTPIARRRLIVSVLAVIVVLGATIALRQHFRSSASGHAGGPGGPGADASPVTVAQATRRTVPLLIDTLGTVTPRATVTVKAQVSGTLTSVLFKEGDTVRAGQVIARIDSRALQAQVLQAQGALEQAQAQLANARVDLSRYEKLIGGGSVSQQTLDTQRSTVAQYAGAVKADRGTLDNLRVQLGYCDIVAPVSGRIGLRSVDAGNYVSSSDTDGIATVTSEDPIDIVFSVAEDRLADIAAQVYDGHALPVAVLDRDKTQILASGTVSALDNVINTSTGMVKLKASAANPTHRLFPNQFVNVRLRTGELRDALVVPTRAIQHGADHDFVLVAGAAQGKTVAHMRSVVSGPVYQDETVLSSGAVKTGDTVIVDGADRLGDGDAVSVVSDSAHAAPAAAVSQASSAAAVH